MDGSSMSVPRMGKPKRSRRPHMSSWQIGRGLASLLLLLYFAYLGRNSPDPVLHGLAVYGGAALLVALAYAVYKLPSELRR